MVFVKGNTVKLVGFKKSYEAIVTGPGIDDECFSAVITKSEFGVEDYNGSLIVGTYDNDFTFNNFVLIEE